MRRRWLFLIFLAVVSVCLWRSARLQTWLLSAARFDGGNARPRATLSHSYVLNEATWLDFRLPTASPLVRVITTANFPKSAVTPDRPGVLRPGAIYSLEYEFRTGGNEVLQAGNFHFRVHPPNAQQASNPRAFYSAQGLLPGSGQTMRQRLASLQPRPSRLWLRLGDHDERIQDVSVRVYCQDELPEYKISHAWRRTNRRQREKLCRASVYGPELLTEYERRNLIKTKWLPVAPSGFEGRDYTRRILYSLDSDQVDRTNTELPAGHLVDAANPGVIPLPDGPGNVRLEFTRVATGDETKAAEINVRWFGSRVEQRDHWHLQAVSAPYVFETELDGGLLEIVATDQFAVRVFWCRRSGCEELSGCEEFEEITPEPSLVRAYVVGPQCAVEYAIEHVGETATPLKLSFRHLLPPHSEATTHDESSRPVRIDWCFVNPTGQVVRGGRFHVQEALSRYDRLTGTAAPMRVTDAAVSFFAVPPGVRTVRIESPDTGVVVSAYSRPPDVIPVTFAPEDYSAFHRRLGWRQSWFPLRPVNHLQRINELQTVTILAQPRPREVDEQRLAGLYQWESFQPSGQWKGRYLLVPREARLPLRWESQGSAFYELPTGVDYDVSLLSDPGHRSVTPQVVCQTEGVLPVNAWVYVNGRLHQELRLRSRLAELRLEALPAQKNETTRLRIETNGEIRVLMNRILQAAETVFFKRMVIRFEGQTLAFDYEKQTADEELLSLTLFHAASQRRARLRVRIEGEVIRIAGPSPDWTFVDRLYELRPTAGQSIPMFAANGERVFEQHHCLLRLGSDLPAGKYTIEVTREDDRTGYLLLSRTTTGLSERRGLATEAPTYVGDWRRRDSTE